MSDIWYKKGLVVGITILFIGVIVAQSTAVVINKKITANVEIPSFPHQLGITLYVDDDNTAGPWDGSIEHPYQNIKDALDNATDGDTIFVFSGYYYESVRIRNQVSLIGEDKYTTFIEGENRHNAIILYDDYINISGFTINNTNNWANDCGIEIQNAWGTHTTHNTITDNIFSNHSSAINVYQSSYNNISDNIIINSGGFSTGSYSSYNIISNNTFFSGNIHIWGDPKYTLISKNYLFKNGITVRGGKGNIIRDNTIEDGGSIYLYWENENNIIENNLLINSGAITLEESTNTIVKSNTFTNSRGIQIVGSKNKYWDTHTIENNNVDSKPIFYYKNKNNTYINSGISQVIFASCDGCYVYNINFSNVKYPIQIAFSTDVEISNCNFNEGIYSSILSVDSSYVKIQDNIIMNNAGNGIEIKYNSPENRIRRNIIINNKNGIKIGSSSSKNSIYSNVIENNSQNGISMGGSDNKIYNNSIINNTNNGISFSGSDSEIYNNIIKNNGQNGISLGDSNNLVYSNSFRNNRVGIYLVLSYDNIISENNFINSVISHVSFRLDYTRPRDNEWEMNYYDDVFWFFPKIFLGSIRTRFYQEDPFTGERYYFYRFGIVIDWNTASEPYDI
jgi:parallel beta-helix repeat protein